MIVFQSLGAKLTNLIIFVTNINSAPHFAPIFRNNFVSAHSEFFQQNLVQHSRRDAQTLPADVAEVLNLRGLRAVFLQNAPELLKNLFFAFHDQFTFAKNGLLSANLQHPGV